MSSFTRPVSRTLRVVARRGAKLQTVRSLHGCAPACGAGGGPPMPPFARLPPPTSQIPEETELVWDDSVAPETCIDFDAPHISSQEVFKTFLASLGFFLGVYLFVQLTDPSDSNPVAPRSAIISEASFKASLGLGDATGEEGDEEDE